MIVDHVDTVTGEGQMSPFLNPPQCSDDVLSAVNGAMPVWLGVDGFTWRVVRTLEELL